MSTDDLVMGGPSTNTEKCKDCEKEFECYRSGSHDWKPKACPGCRSAEIEAYLYKEEIDFIAGKSFSKEDGPDEEDGPWAEGWENRCGIEYLKSAFIKARKLARYIRSKE